MGPGPLTQRGKPLFWFWKPVLRTLSRVAISSPLRILTSFKFDRPTDWGETQDERGHTHTIIYMCIRHGTRLRSYLRSSNLWPRQVHPRTYSTAIFLPTNPSPFSKGGSTATGDRRQATCARRQAPVHRSRSYACTMRCEINL